MEDNKVKIYRFSALNLRRPIPDEKDSASLTWSMRGAFPRITVYTSNNKAYKEDKTLDYNFIIIAPFDIVTLMYFLQVLAMVNNEPKRGSEYAIECLNTKVENGIRTDEVIIQAEVRVGKGDDGVVWIAVTEDGKRKIKFSLLPNSQWFKYKDSDGNVISDKAFLSKMFTTSYIEAIKRLMLPKYSEYVGEVLIDKPNIVKEVKNDSNKRTKETKQEVSTTDSETGETTQSKESDKSGNSSSTTSGGNETGASGDKGSESKSNDIPEHIRNAGGNGEEIEGVDESKLQSKTKVPAEPEQMDSDLEALLNM